MPATATETLLINGQPVSLRGAAPNLGSAANRLGTVYADEFSVPEGGFFRGIDADSGWKPVGGGRTFDFYRDGTARARFSTTCYFKDNIGIGVSVITPDVLLHTDAAGQLALRNGVNAQSLAVYGTYTDDTNHERLRIYGQTGGDFVIATEKGSLGGTQRAIRLQPGLNAYVEVRAETSHNGPLLQLAKGSTRVAYFQYYDDPTVGDYCRLILGHSGSGVHGGMTIIGNGGIQFERTSTAGGGTQWLTYTADSDRYYVRDSINGRMHLELRPAATNAAAMTFIRSKLYVSAGLGLWGVTPPAAQPATPVTLADVISILQTYGLAA